MTDIRVSQPTQIGLEIVVTRANGTVENLGLRSYQSRNPIKQGVVEAMIESGMRLKKDAVMQASTLSLIRQYLRHQRNSTEG